MRQPKPEAEPLGPPITIRLPMRLELLVQAEAKARNTNRSYIIRDVLACGLGNRGPSGSYGTYLKDADVAKIRLAMAGLILTSLVIGVLSFGSLGL